MIARQLVELGYRGVGDAMKREEFEARQKLLSEGTSQQGVVSRQLAGADRNLDQVRIDDLLYSSLNRDGCIGHVVVSISASIGESRRFGE